MNKQTINEMLPHAYKALEETKVAQNGEIKKTFRGQISSFGAAVTTGSLKAAVAFFSDQGASDVERQKLMQAILFVLHETKGCNESNLWNYVDDKQNEMQKRENIINAAIAIKLAMNLYKLKK